MASPNPEGRVSRAKKALVSAAQALSLSQPPKAAIPEQLSTAGAVAGEATFVALHPSPLNPRKRINEATIESLSLSIAAQGVLQPLLVRPASERCKAAAATEGRPEPEWEICAGERRWRAVGLAIRRGDWPPQRPIPITIKALSDFEMRTMAAHENFHREDMEELDQAQFIAELRDEDKLSIDQIADLLKVNKRTINRRLRLLETEPEVQVALAAHRITNQVALALRDGSAAEQRAALADLLEHPDDSWRREPARLRARMLHGMPLVAWALFDKRLYRGEIIGGEADEDGPDEPVFADAAQFLALQRPAIEGVIGKLAADWAFVARAGQDGFSWSDYEWAGEDRHLDAGCIVEIPENLSTIMVKENWIRRPARAAEDAPAEEVRYFTRPQLAQVRAAKTAALQQAVAGDSQLAIALACLALLGAPEIKIRRDYHPEQPDEDSAAEAAIDARLPAEFEPFQMHAPYASEKAARNLGALLGLGDELLPLLAALVARDVGAWHATNQDIGDTPLTVAIARGRAFNSGGVLPEPIASGFEMDEAYLASFDKYGLFRLNAAAGRPPLKISGKKAELVAALVAEPGLVALSQAAPEAKFLTTADLTERLTEHKPARSWRGKGADVGAEDGQ